MAEKDDQGSRCSMIGATMKGKWSVWKMKSDGRKAFAVYRLKDVEKKNTKMNEQNEGKEEA